MSEAQEIIAAARAREDAREAVRKPIDYDRMKRTFLKHKAALTRAINSGNPDKVVLACRAAVVEWDEIGCWPDEWSRWQRALDDALPWHASVRLEDLS